MRLALSVVCALAMSANASARYFDTHVYALIAQRPDAAGSVDVAQTDDFAACCSAFSGSAVGIVFPTAPVELVEFAWIVTTRTPMDAARLMAYTYVPSQDGHCCERTPLDRYEPLVPAGVLMPKFIRQTIDPERWTKRAAGEWWWVVEFRGRPLVYGANLRVVYKVGQ